MAPINKRKYVKLTHHQTYTIRALHQKSGMSVQQILRTEKQLLKGVPRSTIYATAKIQLSKPAVDKRYKNKSAGRQSKVSSRDKSRIVREMAKMQEVMVNFSSTDLQKSCGMMAQFSNATFRRHLNSLGYHYMTNRKKGSQEGEVCKDDRESKRQRRGSAGEVAIRHMYAHRYCWI